MNKGLCFLIYFIFICFVYHLIRDVLQVFEIHSVFTNFFHRPHLWCSQYCDFVTIPLDLLGIYGAVIILKRNYIGKSGVIFIVSILLAFWLMFVFPWKKFLTTISENNFGIWPRKVYWILKISKYLGFLVKEAHSNEWASFALEISNTLRSLANLLRATKKTH